MSTVASSRMLLGERPTLGQEAAFPPAAPWGHAGGSPGHRKMPVREILSKEESVRVYGLKSPGTTGATSLESTRPGVTMFCR